MQQLHDLQRRNRSQAFRELTQDLADVQTEGAVFVQIDRVVQIVLVLDGSVEVVVGHRSRFVHVEVLHPRAFWYVIGRFHVGSRYGRFGRCGL